MALLVLFAEEQHEALPNFYTSICQGTLQHHRSHVMQLGTVLFDISAVVESLESHVSERSELLEENSSDEEWSMTPRPIEDNSNNRRKHASSQQRRGRVSRRGSKKAPILWHCRIALAYKTV